MKESNVTIKLQKTINSENSTGATILLIDELTQLESFKLPEGLQQKIKQAHRENNTKLFTFLGDTTKYLIYVLDTEDEALRRFGATLFDQLKDDKEEVISFEHFGNLTKTQIYALIEGLVLSSYDFTKYKKEESPYKIELHISERNLSESDAQELKILSETTALTKTLVNEPPNYMDALQFSIEVEEAGKKYGFRSEILHKEQIEQLGMGGLLAVNRGSKVPPTLNIMHYKPTDAVNEKPLVLVGKGVTFDTGGYSIKTGGHMSSMKSDMGGGAAVLGAISAIAGNKLPYYVIGIVPATDNKIDSNAMLVDDIITTMDKTTVEVQNTDAEGRLILCDVLTYAKKFTPDLVIDIATLTGASAAITGSFGIAALGNSQSKIEELKLIGEMVYERLLQLPLWDEYKELLKSPVADMKNIGGPIGGASTAAKFLEHFTAYDWIHLDIAGAAFIEDKKFYKQNGATAVPVRLLYHYVKSKI